MAISRQRLSGPRAPAHPNGMLEVVRDLGCIQMDPISVVARTQFLVLLSRLGPYDPSHLDSLLFEEKQLFEYWAHAASIVLTEDYPVHSMAMRRHASGESSWSKRVREWMAANEELRAYILSELREHGPLMSRDLEDKSAQGWRSSGWTNERNVSRMLDHLWTKGEIMVAGRRGLQRMWDLAERCLPDWVQRDEWPQHRIVMQAAQKSLRALGVARPKEIEQHFTRSRYPGLPKALTELEAQGRIEQVRVVEDGREWPGTWYVYAADLPLLESLERGDWEPRTALLSPFDNLICDRTRTEKLFDFHFRIEIYVPKEQRQYGYYVLPILHGDRLIGRIDPQMDRKQKRLKINAVYAEPGAPDDPATATSIRGAIEELGTFLGAKEIAFTGQVPEAWKGKLS